jgi:hypothetical protein
MHPRKIILTPELIEEAHVLYDAGVVHVDDIAARLGMGHTSFYRMVRKLGWAHRRDDSAMRAAIDQAADAAPKPAVESGEPDIPAKPFSIDEMIPKLEAAINREFALAEHALAHGEPRNAEKTAKTMASLVRSLAELKRVKNGAQAHGTNDAATDEPPARDLAELKAELARRIDRLRRARDAERGA